jgi:hypothetical protein
MGYNNARRSGSSVAAGFPIDVVRKAELGEVPELAERA